MREVDRLAIEYGLTVARIRGPVSGRFTWSADEPMRCCWPPAARELVPLMSVLRHRAVR
jgi:hypothetical protein